MSDNVRSALMMCFIGAMGLLLVAARHEPWAALGIFITTMLATSAFIAAEFRSDIKKRSLPSPPESGLDEKEMRR